MLEPEHAAMFELWLKESIAKGDSGSGTVFSAVIERRLLRLRRRYPAN